MLDILRNLFFYSPFHSIDSVHYFIFFASIAVFYYVVVIIGFRSFEFVRTFYKYFRSVLALITGLFVYFIGLIIISGITLMMGMLFIRLGNLTLYNIYIKWIIEGVIFSLNGPCLLLIGFLFMHIAEFGVQRTVRDGRIVGSQYEKGGRLRNWSRATERYNRKINWLPRVARNLIDSGLFTERNKLIIAAPAANRGNYEIILTRILAKELDIQITCIASDLAFVQHHEKSEEGKNYRFLYFQKIDGEKLEPFYQDLGLGEVDLIWDIKGCLWHSKDKKRVLLQYARLLRPGGSLIVEAHPGGELITRLRTDFLQFTGRSWGYCEPSTYSQLKKPFRKSQALQDAFEEIWIQDADNHDCDVVLFRKR